MVVKLSGTPTSRLVGQSKKKKEKKLDGHFITTWAFDCYATAEQYIPHGMSAIDPPRVGSAPANAMVSMQGDCQEGQGEESG